MSAAGFDALLLASFGGPESPEEVVPFLERVTAGRGIPRERLAEVGQHYFTLGGVSPINAQNRLLIAALEAELARRGLDLPVYWGNRNSTPFFADTMRELAAEGHRRVLALATSAYSSYSGCRQYREDLAAALAESETAGLLEVVKVRPYNDVAGFAAAMRPSLQSHLRRWREAGVPLERAHVFFTTHSIPDPMSSTSGPEHCDNPAEGLYVRQHLRVAESLMDSSEFEWSLVYQSRSGAPGSPWLEPDINDALAEAHERGVTHALMVPIGFISDHVEVVWDLDTQAMATANDLGMDCQRVDTAGVHDEFVRALIDLVESAADADGTGRPAEWPGLCADNCCPNPRAAKPVVQGI